jgi:hypothetical protein
MRESFGGCAASSIFWSAASDCAAVGDALDFWRVEAFDPDRRLNLVAEMKLPGRAWLQFEVEPVALQPDSPQSNISQTAIFEPAGLGGLAYWYALYPFHRWIFAGMLREIATRAEAAARAGQST